MTTPQATIKKITVEQLRPGMFVDDLNCGWMTHPFVRNKFPVRDEDDVQKILQAGVRELYIDTTRGADVQDAYTAIEAKQRSEEAMIAAATSEPPLPKVQSLAQELGAARRVHLQAGEAVRRMMQDVRLGKAAHMEAMEPIVERMTTSILRNSGALLSLCRIKDADDYTFLHSVSVCALMISFCRTLGKAPDEIREAGMGGMLHDIGKSKIPLSILNKPGRLTDEEFAVMRSHPAIGLELLSSTEGIGPIPLTIVIQHHERIDGSGYPNGLPGDKIHEMGQIAAVVDVYDAITSDRCYHKGMAPTDALRKLFEWSKFHFRPELVQSFMRCVGIYPTGVMVLLESKRLAVVIEPCESSLLTPKVRAFYDTNRCTYIKPINIDLAKPVGHGGGDSIVRHAEPGEWGVDPLDFV